MEVVIKVESEVIKDILMTALLGGSNYWCYLPDLDPNKHDFWSTIKEMLEDETSTTKIPVHDGDFIEERLGYISRENIQRGLQMYINNGYTLNGECDADDADVLFQYIVVGDIVFG